jgi:NDP-sugar pyrophosphorylase family protein
MTQGTATDRAMPDQAVILAAGFSSRLRPLTADLPKCMVPVGGRPLIAQTVEHLRSHGVVHLVLNLHHAGARIVDYLGDGSAFGVDVRYSWEREILGTAGGARQAARSFDGPFFVWYGDNLSTIRIDDLWAFHASAGADVTMALYRREDTSQSGVAEVDGRGRVRRFVEKPKPGATTGNWVSAGVLVVEPGVLGSAPGDGAWDFGTELLPDLAARGGRLFGYRMSGDEGLWWIDTPDDLQWVRAEFGPMTQESRRA